jgi:uncharacterized protein YbaP (TraB family)
MRRQSPFLGFLFSLLIFSALSKSAVASPVWKVTKVHNGLASHIYLAGTVHVLSQQDYPLPEAFEHAYKASETLVFETDITTLQSSDYQHYFLEKVSYDYGDSLREVISPTTFSALEMHLRQRGIPMQVINGFKPGMVMITLTMYELQRLGMSGTGVDEFYNKRAIQQGRTLKYLESVESQIDFMASMGEGSEDQFIQHVLEELNIMPEVLDQTKRAWRKGDMTQLESLLMTPLRNEDPNLYKTLLVDRNNKWLPQLHNMLNTPEIEFVLVGALHLVGEDGLLVKMRDEGYITQQLP